MKGIIRPDWPAPGEVVAGTTTIAVAASELPRDLKLLNQVHGATVASAEAVRQADEPLDADAVIGRSRGDLCAVRTADCLPVLFCSREGGEVAAAHAGWRGLAAGILENTIAAMSTPSPHLMAWLGPAISQANFEVGDEVRDVFIEQEAGAAAWFERNARGRWQADLYGLARQRLARCGLKAVYGGQWCTFADAERFHSYRRDPDCGRMVSFVLLK
jgi:YfiH family protein